MTRHAVATAALALSLALPGQALAVQAHGDFDGDGQDDLAIGAPGEGLGGVDEAGAVYVIYGSTTGLSTTVGPRTEVYNQDNDAIAGNAEPRDGFGAAVAAGDFNGDGRDDLAIGAPGENVGSLVDAGYVHVIYGAAGGLSVAGGPGFEAISPGRPGASGTAERGDRFGDALAAGTFETAAQPVEDAEDLAIGIPGEDVASSGSAGALYVTFGDESSNALGPTAGPADDLVGGSGDQMIFQGTGAQGRPETGDRFGAALGAGGLDLAVGVPGEGIGSAADAGLAHVLEARSTGIFGLRTFTQNSPGITGAAEEGDQFGSAVAVGNFTGIGDVDVAAGAPGESVGSAAGAGVVNVLYRDANPRRTVFSQGSPDAPGRPERGDGFGSALAASDFQGGSHDDLAVGVPTEDRGSASDAGGLSVFYATSAAGLQSDGQVFDQGSEGMPGKAETADRFAEALGVGRFDGGPFADLAIGVPGESIRSAEGAGAVNTIYGAAASLTTAAGPLSEFFSQLGPDIRGRPESGDAFGAGL